MSTTLERPLRHGILTKRSISKSRTTLHAKFQERWFVLTGDTLTYHTPNGQTFRGKIHVSGIRVCEKVDRDTFDRSQVFQIVYLDKEKPRALYLQGSSKAEQEDWINSIRSVSEKVVGDKMLQYYHSGAYIKKKWSCCKKLVKYDEGCSNTYRADTFSSYALKTPPLAINPSKPMLHSQSTQHIKKSNSVKRKLSLQGLLRGDTEKEIKHNGEGSVSSVTSSVVNSIASSVEVLDSSEVFSEGELSEDDECGISPGFRYKCSLDSSGNSPGL